MKTTSRPLGRAAARRLLAVAALAFAAPLSAQAAIQGKGLAGIFPRDSFLVFETAGLGQAREAVLGTKLHATLAKTCADCGIDVPELGSALAGNAVRAVQRALARAEIEVDEVRTLLDGPFAIGVGRPSLHAWMTPSILLAISTAGREEQVARLLASMEKKLELMLDSMAAASPKWSSPLEGDLKLRRLELENFGFRIHYTVCDSVLLIGTGQGYLESVIHTMRGKAASMLDQASLRVAEAHVREQAGASAAPLLRFVVNTEPFMRALAPLAPYDIDELADALGFRELSGLAWTSRLGRDGSVDAASLTFSGAESGLLKSVLGKHATGLGAAFCPEKTFAYFDLAYDAEAAAKAGLAILDALPGALVHEVRREAGRDLGRAVSRVDRRLQLFGLSVQDVSEVFSLIGDEVSVAVHLEQQIPQGLVFLKLRGDAQVARAKLLEKLQALCSGENMPKLRHNEGRDYWFATLRTPAITLTPSIAFRGDTVILSPFKNFLSEALARFDDGKPSLAGDEDFKSLTGRAAAMHGFLRYGEPLTAYWPIVRLALAEAVQQVGGNDDGLPGPEVLAPALGSVKWSIVADQDGVTSQAVDTLGLSMLYGYAALGFDWFFERVRNSER